MLKLTGDPEENTALQRGKRTVSSEHSTESESLVKASAGREDRLSMNGRDTGPCLQVKGRIQDNSSRRVKK